MVGRPCGWLLDAGNRTANGGHGRILCWSRLVLLPYLSGHFNRLGPYVCPWRAVRRLFPKGLLFEQEEARERSLDSSQAHYRDFIAIANAEV
jgi:hypothetical protein